MDHAAVWGASSWSRPRPSSWAPPASADIILHQEDAFAEDDELALRAGEGDAVVDPEAGWYRIHTRYNGECLDIEGNSGNDGALILNWPCHYGNNHLLAGRWAHRAGRSTAVHATGWLDGRERRRDPR